MWWSTRLFLIDILPALYFRLAFNRAGQGHLGALLLGGAADIGVIALWVLTTASLQARTRSRSVSVLSSLLLWGYYGLVTAYFSAMHALPTPEQAKYLLDPHFLLASLDASALPALLGAVLLGALLARLDLRLVRLRGRAPAALALLLSASLLVPGPGGNGNPLVTQIRSFLSRGAGLPGGLPRLAHDLSGVPLTAGPDEPPNILLVVLEGIPGGYVSQNVTFVNGSSDFTMPKTSRWAERGLRVPNFLSHRNQTINGLYSMLCADYPRLTDGTPIVQELLARPETASNDSLPGVLARNGYNTTYLQAAGLRFMDKDRFMKRIGFGEVLGEEWFEPDSGVFFTRWGINDRDFLLQSLRKIGELNERRRRSRERGESAPWFLTLLTVGTHHPYTLPDDYAGGEGLPPKLRSVAFLDDAVDLFLSRLEEEGVLEDTLVILTSDESHGMNADILLAGNWGLCVALPPRKHGTPPVSAVNEGLFGLADLPLSILDYAGLAASADAIGGRSIFRDYAASERRALPGSWGDRFFIVSGDALLMKDFGPGDFVKYTVSGSPFALTNGAKAEPLGSGTSLLSWAARAFEQDAGKRSGSAVWRFLPDGSSFRAPAWAASEDPPGIESKIWLSGGQYIQLEKGGRYVLDLEIAAPSSNDASVRLDWMVHGLDGPWLLSGENCPLPVLGPGERLRLSCSVEIRKDFTLDSARLAARALAGSASPGARVEVGTFALRPVPPEGPAPTGRTLYDGEEALLTLERYEGPKSGLP